ncbi:MAG: MarR family winged helix-turn-helix transcriptional regulator, partial [Thermodesulfovibrionales bacterium]|nr:MarR family winged helix-turn-helix transcriptional regulator [Thermodesulfovibrionales bacterium]
PAQEILIVLNRNIKHECTMSDIVSIGRMNRQTVYNNLRILLNLGLVVEKREEGFPPRRLISLTEKGRKVAEKLEEIERVLTG